MKKNDEDELWLVYYMGVMLGIFGMGIILIVLNYINLISGG